MPAQEPTRPAAFFDFDGTLIPSDSTVLLLLFTARRFPRSFPDLARVALAVPAFLLGLLPRDRMKLLAVAALRRVPPRLRNDFFAEFHDRCLLPRYSRELLRRVKWHQEQRHLLVLVSASFDLYLARAARRLGFDHLVCTRAALDPAPALLTPNCRGEEKVRRISGESFLEQVSWARSWAYGNDRSDLPLLKKCGNPVAVNPDRTLRKEARRNGWPTLNSQGEPSRFRSSD